MSFLRQHGTGFNRMSGGVEAQKGHVSTAATTEIGADGAGISGDLTPSSGLVGLYLLLQICGHVTIYGMSLDPSINKTSIKDSPQGSYHYFKRYVDSEVLLAHPHHSFDLEGNLMRHLNATNVVQLCTVYPARGSCGLGAYHT